MYACVLSNTIPINYISRGSVFYTFFFFENRFTCIFPLKLHYSFVAVQRNIKIYNVRNVCMQIQRFLNDTHTHCANKSCVCRLFGLAVCKGKRTWYNDISIHAIIIRRVFYSLSWWVNLTGHTVLLFLTYLTTSETVCCCCFCCCCSLKQIFIQNHFHGAVEYIIFHCYYYYVGSKLCETYIVKIFI